MPDGYLEAVQIFVSLPPGLAKSYISLEAEPTDVMTTVRSYIRDRVDLPKEYDLYFNSQKLADDKTLADYSIPKESTLTLVYRTTGDPGSIANTGAAITHTGVPMGASSLLVGVLLLLATRSLRRRRGTLRLGNH